jgi:hypothetical protein
MVFPWWLRVFLWDLRGIKDLFGEPHVTALHLLASLAVILVALFTNFMELKKAVQAAALVVVFLALGFQTYTLSRAARLQDSEEAIIESNLAYQYEEGELDPKRNPPLDGPRLTILDQAIAQVIGHVHSAVGQRFPEFYLRTVSLHFVPKNRSDKVWDLIQEGVHVRDRELFDRQISFVGRTLNQGRPRYCQDVGSTPMKGECEPIQPPGGAVTSFPFRSLLCIPLGEKPHFAAICFDSMMANAFDDREQALEGFLAEPIRQLSTNKQLSANKQLSINEQISNLLLKYREVDSSQFGQSP